MITIFKNLRKNRCKNIQKSFLLIPLCIVMLISLSCGKGNKPVFESGEYKNILTEIGVSQEEIDARIDEVYQNFFYGDDNQRLYYEFGPDTAYFLDVNNNDIRSEGMSYGMMFCVQRDMQEEFNKLWKFACDKMKYKEGDREGFFAWQLAPDGTIIGDTPAPDGEEYFAMALYMASNLWGDGEGIFNYKKEADDILNHMVRHKEILGLPSGSWNTNMIDPKKKQVVFVPYGGGARFTDPSYHLPAFYELFALWAGQDNQLWSEIAAESRILFQKACHPETGLAPDYCDFKGVPMEKENHYRFEYDAWRVAMNITLDSYWWNKDPWQREVWTDTYMGFFLKQGIGKYDSRYNIDGTDGDATHSPGLVAMNAMPALISDKEEYRVFVKEFWNTPIPTGRMRYFDGCLYLFALLNLSGNYKIIMPQG